MRKEGKQMKKNELNYKDLRVMCNPDYRKFRTYYFWNWSRAWY